ncbi:MAG: glycosyltransferase [Nitrososphaeria archaeon]
MGENAKSLPLVTIGVCVKNCENTISTAIKSIINQDYDHKRIEIIFVDDGSTDRTLSIIKSDISNVDIETKVFHHEWRGLGVARNIVVDNARGKYIIWVDGDMELSTDFVRKSVEFMENNPSVGVGKGKYGLLIKGNIVSDLESIEYFTTTFKNKHSFHSTSLGTGGSIYRVEAIKKVEGFDKNITGAGEDSDIEYRMKNAGWTLGITSAIFHEKRRETWRSLWDEYFWRGLGASKLFEKGEIKEIYKLWPPIITIVELRRVQLAYKLTRRKIVFLLPFHYIFKRLAWFYGFLKGSLA